MLIQFGVPACLFIGISSTHYRLYIFPCFFTKPCLIRNLFGQVELNCYFFEIIFDHLDSFFNSWVIFLNLWKIGVWVLLSLINIVILSKSTNIVKNNMNSWMQVNIGSFIETIEHKKHAIHAPDSWICYSLWCIWHNTENQRTYSLLRIVKLIA